MTSIKTLTPTQTALLEAREALKAQKVILMQARESAKAERQAARENRAAAKAARSAKAKPGAASMPASAPAPRHVVAKVVGGSTITQQLAKNLFLSGERTAVRKAQEFLITFMLEACLDKPRILTIYLNNVEWGEGVFGAQAAAEHYFRTDAAHLSAPQAAQIGRAHV